MRREVNENDPYVVIETRTGELVTSLDYGDSIRRKQQDEHYQEFDDNFKKGEKFVKIFDDSLDYLIENLTNGEIAFVIKLLPYISYDDGILRDKKKRILGINDIADKLKMSHEGVRKVVIALISKGVLGEHKTGSIDNPKILNKCITVNPHIFMKGRKMNRTIIGLFENSQWNSLR